MRSGTSLLQHVICSSAHTNPFVYGCRYLTAQIATYSRYAGPDKLYIEHYLGDPADLFEFTQSVLGSFLMHTHRQLGSPENLVLKNPELARYIQQAAALLPQAQFIISVREPKDTIASMIDVGQMHRENKIASVLAEIGRDVTKLCEVYRSFCAPALEALRDDRNGFQERLCFVPYEALVKDTGHTIAQISTFGGVPISLADICPHGTWRSRIETGNDLLSNHPHLGSYLTKLSGGPISDASIERYQQVLNESEAKVIYQQTADLRRVFGYDL